MKHHSPADITQGDDGIEREAAPILGHLCRPATVLAVARDMDKAVVVRDLADGETQRLAVVDRALAQAMALNGWIDCATPGRVSRYHVTATGREVCRRSMAAAENRAARGFEEAQTPFIGAPADGAETAVASPAAGDARVRYSLPDSPAVALARRRDRDGRPFLSEALVAAAERLREDYELARMGHAAAGGWETLVTAPPPAPEASAAPGPSQARDRVARALHELGPGLGDIALRCCCYQEGLETAEKRLGWSARSAKVVLRIALQRLNAHYRALGPGGGLIG